MSKDNEHFEYSINDFQIVFQSSIHEDEYYGIDNLERKKLKIILTKYGCKKCYNSLPDKVVLNLNKVTWNNDNNCFEVEPKKVSVRMNTLQEVQVEYFPEKKMFE